MSDTLFDKPQNFSEQDVSESAFISIDSNGEDNTNGLRRHKSESSIIRRRQNLSSITSSLSEKDVEETKICNNYRFGFKKWKGHVTQRPLHNRSETVQNLYADVNKIKLEQAPRSVVFNILYVILFGWWQAVIYLVLGLVMYLTIVGRHYGLFCLKMSRYYLWPFRKFVYITLPNGLTYSYHTSSSSNDSGSEEHKHLLEKRTVTETCVSFWCKVQSYIWLILCVPILVLMHTVGMVVSWLFVISMPIAKMNLKSLTSLIFLPPEHILIDEVNEYSQKCVLGALAIVPLTYYIGMSIISISAQTSVAVGAVVNATFGSIVELIIFVVALNKGKQAGTQLCFNEIVKASLTGTIIGCTLLVPGICMVVGGLKYTAQSFNPKSASVSCLLMFVCVGGIFAPTIFSQVLGNMNCEKCENMYSSNDTLMNSTYGLNCEQCTNSIFGVDRETTLYNRHIKPLVYAICLMLPVAYIIGLIFTLKTHTSHLTVDFTAEQLKRDNVNHQGHSHGSPQWGIVKSMVILLSAATLIGVCADIVTDNIQNFLNSTQLSTYFVSVTFLSLIPALPEIVNGIQFALQNNINLGIEIGTSVAIQVCTIEVPLLVLVDIIY
ncbi:Ca2+:H+ antiporter, partial [Mytilus galloprovincialis]